MQSREISRNEISTWSNTQVPETEELVDDENRFKIEIEDMDSTNHHHDLPLDMYGSVHYFRPDVGSFLNLEVCRSAASAQENLQKQWLSDGILQWRA